MVQWHARRGEVSLEQAQLYQFPVSQSALKEYLEHTGGGSKLDKIVPDQHRVKISALRRLVRGSHDSFSLLENLECIACSC